MSQIRFYQTLVIINTIFHTVDIKVPGRKEREREHVPPTHWEGTGSVFRSHGSGFVTRTEALERTPDAVVGMFPTTLEHPIPENHPSREALRRLFPNTPRVRWQALTCRRLPILSLRQPALKVTCHSYRAPSTHQAQNLSAMALGRQS